MFVSLFVLKDNVEARSLRLDLDAVKVVFSIADLRSAEAFYGKTVGLS